MRSRSTATALAQITKILKPKKEAQTRVQKTARRTVVSSATARAVKPLGNGEADVDGGVGDSHPLEVALDLI